MHAGRRRPAVELHGSVGQRDTLLHSGGPRRSGRCEGVGAESHQCNENLLHLATCNFAVFQADLLCSVGEHEAISTSFFLGCEGAVDVLLQFRTLFDQYDTFTQTNKIGVGFFTAQDPAWRLELIDSPRRLYRS